MRIEIAGLRKSYGDVVALRGIDLEIGPGMFGLLGPNGAGKTTLIRILATLIRPGGGRVVVGGFDVADGRQKWAVKRLLGYLPQEHSLYPNLSVREFLDYIATLKEHLDRRGRAAEVDRVLELAGLQAVASRRIKALSGGMKRRTGIAQALIGNPQLLIVDEPTAGLDPEERVRFRTLLAGLSRDRIVILSTHIVEDISATCQDIAVLHSGEVRFHGSPASLIRAAEGQSWEVLLPADHQPDPAWHVVASVRDADGLRLRVVGSQPSSDARAASPTLEEAYLALTYPLRN